MDPPSSSRLFFSRFSRFDSFKSFFWFDSAGFPQRTYHFYCALREVGVRDIISTAKRGEKDERKEKKNREEKAKKKKNREVRRREANEKLMLLG
jgi:hypothetical protein